MNEDKSWQDPITDTSEELNRLARVREIYVHAQAGHYADSAYHLIKDLGEALDGPEVKEQMIFVHTDGQREPWPLRNPVPSRVYHGRIVTEIPEDPAQFEKVSVDYDTGKVTWKEVGR